MLPVQYSGVHEFIGGPREYGARRRNYVTNPAFRFGTTGHAAGASTALTRVAVAGAIRPYTGRWARTAGAGGALWSTYAWTAPAAGRYAISAYVFNTAGNAQPVTLAIGNYAGSSVAVASNTAAVGGGWTRLTTVVDIAGGDLVGQIELRDTAGTGTNANVMLATAFAINLLEPGTTAVPRYWDGDQPGYFWTGDEHASASDQDGTRAVLNAEADPDFIGYASEITGMDGAEVRESFVDNIEADGGVHGEFYQSRRPFTVTAAIGGNTTPATRNARLQRWTAATRALRARGAVHREGAYAMQPDGFPRAWTRFRRQIKPEPSGYTLKSSPVGLVSADPRVYAEHPQRFILVGSGSGTAGRTYNRSYVVNYDWGPSRGILQPINAGDADTPVFITIEATSGTSATLAVQNETTGEEISMNGSLLVNEKIEIDTYRKTVTHYAAGGTPITNAFDRLELGRTRWFGLAPGENRINLLAGTMGAGLQMYVDWRDAWA